MKLKIVYFGEKRKDLIDNANIYHAGFSQNNFNYKKYFDDIIIDHGWTLFINLDYYTLPLDNELNQLVAYSRADILHTGNKISDFENLKLNRFIKPTFIYNLKASKDIDSTSLDLSIDCFLIKDVIGKRFHWLNPFQQYSIRSLGFLWGAELYKAGAIIRYTPRFKIKQLPKTEIYSLKNELTFIKFTSGSKWLLWATLRLIMLGYNPLEIFQGFYYAKKTKSPQLVEIRRIDNFKLQNNKDDIKISVFTPTLNRYQYLRRELELLNNQNFKITEVIITDQSNPKQEPKSWLPENLNFKIHYQPQSDSGQCVAWNYCLSNASGDYFLFLGDDADFFDENFVRDMVGTLLSYNADVVGCNVKERDGDYPYSSNFPFVSDTFPICLVKKEIFLVSGGYDFAFNKGKMADGELAIRMHLNGALILIDPNVKIYHHRAPVGGLRHHGQRKNTRQSSQRSLFKFNKITFSEIYLITKHFKASDLNEWLLQRWFEYIIVRSSLMKTTIKTIIFFSLLPYLNFKYLQQKKIAKEFLLNKGSSTFLLKNNKSQS
jgi:glycosyltransferase involved in cell wall biosynthesis